MEDSIGVAVAAVVRFHRPAPTKNNAVPRAAVRDDAVGVYPHVPGIGASLERLEPTLPC